MSDEVRVVGFYEINEETGDGRITFFGDCDFSLMMLSLEEMSGVKTVIHWPKRNFMRIYIDKPFEFVHQKFDELFEFFFKTKPKYFKEIEES